MVTLNIGRSDKSCLQWTESDSIDSCPLSPTQSTEWFNSAALERRIEHNVDISHDASPPLKEWQFNFQIESSEQRQRIIYVGRAGGLRHNGSLPQGLIYRLTSKDDIK